MADRMNVGVQTPTKGVRQCARVWSSLVWSGLLG